MLIMMNDAIMSGTLDKTMLLNLFLNHSSRQTLIDPFDQMDLKVQKTRKIF